MPAFKDITGQRFGRLVAFRYVGASKWLCGCDCGNHIEALPGNLRRKTRSCGCAHREQLIARNTKHGHTPRGAKTSAYARWATMIQRCRNPNDARFPYYGGRGISVCDRWLTFENFLSDMGEPPLGMWLDRIDNDGNYELGNCRWATASEQALNRRSRWRHRKNPNLQITTV